MPHVQAGSCRFDLYNQHNPEQEERGRHADLVEVVNSIRL